MSYMKRDELKVEVTRRIIELKIVDFIKNNKETDFNKYKEKIQNLAQKRDEIYELNQETIDKVYNEYLNETKK